MTTTQGQNIQQGTAPPLYGCDRAPYMFEGKNVEMTKAKLQSSPLEIDDRVLGIDDMVELTVVARITGVDHPVDNKSGELHRVHRLTVIEADFIRGWKPDKPGEFH